MFGSFSPSGIKMVLVGTDMGLGDMWQNVMAVRGDVLQSIPILT